MIIETTDVNDELPYKKIETGDAWKVNIEFVNPSLDYKYKNNLFTDKDLSDRGILQLKSYIFIVVQATKLQM